MEIIDRADRTVVTVVEVVRLGNKVRGAAGRRAFVEKRREVAASPAHWLEIDLLRAGTRTVNPAGVPVSDYLIYLDRASTIGRSRFAWPVNLDQPLPVVAVPLRGLDADVPLDLKIAMQTIYDRAGYDLEIDYSRDATPPLTEPQSAWADAMLREKNMR